MNPKHLQAAREASVLSQVSSAPTLHSSVATPIEISKAALPASPINPPSSPLPSDASISIPGTPVFSFFPFIYPAASLIDIPSTKAGRTDKGTTSDMRTHWDDEGPSTPGGSPLSSTPYETEAATAPPIDAPQDQLAVSPTDDEDVDMEAETAQSNLATDAFEIEEIEGAELFEGIEETLEPRTKVKKRTRKTWPKGEEAILKEAVKIWMEIHPTQRHLPTTKDDDLWDDIIMYCRSVGWRPRGTLGALNPFKPEDQGVQLKARTLQKEGKFPGLKTPSQMPKQRYDRIHRN